MGQNVKQILLVGVLQLHPHARHCFARGFWCFSQPCRVTMIRVRVGISFLQARCTAPCSGQRFPFHARSPEWVAARRCFQAGLGSQQQPPRGPLTADSRRSPQLPERLYRNLSGAKPAARRAQRRAVSRCLSQPVGGEWGGARGCPAHAVPALSAGSARRSCWRLLRVQKLTCKLISPSCPEALRDVPVG